MFGLFDPPQTKAQKKAATQAQSMREQAVRDALIELQMLIRWQRRAREVMSSAHHAQRFHLSKKLLNPIDESQDTIDRFGQFSDAFAYDLAAYHSNPNNADDYEKLATFELEGRGVFIAAREELKAHLVPLGVLTSEVEEALATHSSS